MSQSNYKKHFGYCLDYEGCYNAVSVPGSTNCVGGEERPHSTDMKRIPFFQADRNFRSTKDGPRIQCCVNVACMNPTFGFYCLNTDKTCSLDFPDGVLDPNQLETPFLALKSL